MSCALHSLPRTANTFRTCLHTGAMLPARCACEHSTPCTKTAVVYLSRRDCCCGSGVGSASSADGLRALLTLPSRLLLLHVLTGCCRLGDLPEAAHI